MTTDTISRIELGKASPELRTVRRIAEALGTDVGQLQEAFEKGMAASLEIQRRGRELNERQSKADVAADDMLPTGILAYSETQITDIPIFEASLAAGPWVDVSEIGEVCDPRAIDHGLFRVRLAGDSMAPTYPDGSLVEFKCLRADRDGVIVGKSYYVQKSDGTATFKRVSKMTEDTFELSAINKKKYPKPMIVERGLVTRMARALYRLQEAE